MATPNTDKTASAKKPAQTAAKPPSEELAKANEAARAAEMATVNPDALAAFDALGGDEFVELQSDFYSWKPVTCADTMLHGYLVGKRKLESEAFGEFDAFFLLTKSPTKAHKGKEEKPFLVPANRMVMCVANAVLSNRLDPLLLNPEEIYEVGIVYAGAVKTKEGFDANNFKVKVSKKPLPYETIKPMLLAASTGFEKDAGEFPPSAAAS